jgi:hypothetical protein
MKLVMLITAQIEKGLDVAVAWQEAGATGVTILRSYGLFTLQRTIQRGEVELPRMVSSVAAALAHLLDTVEENGHILISVVEPEIVDKLINAASNILGDLTEPNNGILVVLDLERVIGLHDHSKS